MIAIMTASIADITMTQRFSVCATISSSTIPSCNGRRRGFEFASANGASRKEQQEVKSKPANKEQCNSDAGDDQGSEGPFLSASAASSAPIGAATCSGVCAAEACGWSCDIATTPLA
jgi:hypothetical protein